MIRTEFFNLSTCLIALQDYETSSYYYQFKFEYDEKQCVVQVIENGMLLVLNADQEDYSMYYFMDESYEINYSSYYGQYSGSDEETSVTYTISLSHESITLSIGDSGPQEAEILYFTSSTSWFGNKVSFILKVGMMNIILIYIHHMEPFNLIVSYMFSYTQLQNR